MNIVKILKQGLEKMQTMRGLGLEQGILLPQQRPHLPSLRALGFSGSDKKIIESAHLIFGSLDATINHDHGYTFIRFGSIIERADMTSRILDIRSETLITTEEAKPYENIQWISLLRSLSAYQMYRQQMGVRVQRADVIEFIMHSEIFPRSILFCLYELKTLIESLLNSGEIIKVIDKAIYDLKHKTMISTQKINHTLQ